MGVFGKVRRKVIPKTVIIGLDGVPYSLLRRSITGGRLRNMASLFSEGYLGPLEVCLPEISSVSWSSFMTGTQPGEHGIFGFTDLEPGTYKLIFPNFLSLKARTLFDEIGETGMRSVVINLPSTYPAREISGVLISGFVAIDLNKAVYPAYILPKLNQMGYVIDINTTRAREDPDFLMKDLCRTLEIRGKATDYFWANENWSLFVVAITGTDRLNHFLWKAYEDENHPRHRDFVRYYQKVDDFIGRIYDRFLALKGTRDGENHLVILSDHGFEGIKSEVYLNSWLQQVGLLSFDTEQPESLENISETSKAFAMDPSRIYINKRGKYPKGNVEARDVERVKADVRSALESCIFEDKSLAVRSVYDRDDIYWGPLARYGPDMVVLANSGFDLKGKVGSSKVFDRTALEGRHTYEGAFFFSSKGKRAKTILEVKRLILEEYYF